MTHRARLARHSHLEASKFCVKSKVPRTRGALSSGQKVVKDLKWPKVDEVASVSHKTELRAGTKNARTRSYIYMELLPSIQRTGSTCFQRGRASEVDVPQETLSTQEQECGAAVRLQKTLVGGNISYFSALCREKPRMSDGWVALDSVSRFEVVDHLGNGKTSVGSSADSSLFLPISRTRRILETDM